MILVSFSSAEDALSNDVNKYTTFRMQGTENPPFRFFWDTRYRLYYYIKRKIKIINNNSNQWRTHDFFSRGVGVVHG